MTDMTPPPAEDPTPVPVPPPVDPTPAPAAPTPPPAAPTPPPAAPAPMPPPPAAGPVAGSQNGMGTAALVMGILQFVCLGPIASILAIVFGKIGMNKAKQGLATNGGVAKAGFWLGIIGLILTVIGTIIAVFVIGFGVKVATESVDPAKNSQTGLADGNYGMYPTSSIFLNEKCAFGGAPINLDTAEELTTSVTVVGIGSTQCGPEMDTPNTVEFVVSGGVAEIIAVQ